MSEVIKQYSSRPFDYNVTLRAVTTLKTAKAQLYKELFRATSSESAIIHGLQVIIPQMVVYYDPTVPAVISDYSGIVNGIKAELYLGQDPTAGNLRAGQAVPDYEIMLSDGTSNTIAPDNTNWIIVPKKQIFGVLFTAQAAPWAGTIDITIRAWGKYVVEVN